VHSKFHQLSSRRSLKNHSQTGISIGRSLINSHRTATKLTFPVREFTIYHFHGGRPSAFVHRIWAPDRGYHDHLGQFSRMELSTPKWTDNWFVPQPESKKKKEKKKKNKAWLQFKLKAQLNWKIRLNCFHNYPHTATWEDAGWQPGESEEFKSFSTISPNSISISTMVTIKSNPRQSQL